MLVGVPERSPHHLPKWTVQVEFLDVRPGGWRIVEVNIDARLRPSMEDRSKDIEKLWLVCLCDNRDHLAIDVGGRIVRHHQALDFLKPVLGVEEFTPVGDMA